MNIFNLALGVKSLLQGSSYIVYIASRVTAYKSDIANNKNLKKNLFIASLLILPIRINYFFEHVV